jgi:hypothetical protein
VSARLDLPGPAPTRAAAALALALLAAGPAQASPRAAPQHAPVTAAGDRLSASLDLGPAFPEEALRRLGNGLTNVVSLVVSVVPEEGGPPVAVTGRIVEVLYDVWEEDYTVTVRDARLPRPVRRSVADQAALGRLLTDARALDLGPLGLLPPGRFRLEARVEVNPVSSELMARTRELLANPGLSGRPGAGTRSVLGAAAGFLLREPAPSDDVTFLRSRHFGRAEIGLP